MTSVNAPQRRGPTKMIRLSFRDFPSGAMASAILLGAGLCACGSGDSQGTDAALDCSSNADGSGADVTTRADSTTGTDGSTGGDAGLHSDTAADAAAATHA